MKNNSFCPSDDNVTHLVDFESAPRKATVISLSIVFSTGIALHLLVVWLSLKLPELKGKDYRIFLLNLSLIDIAYALVNFAVNVLLGHIEFFCHWGSLLGHVLGSAGANGMVPVVFNRYIAICCHPDLYNKVFGSRLKKCLICLEPIVFSLVLVIPFGMTLEVGPDSFNLICLSKESNLMNVAVLMLQLHLYTILFFCSYKLIKVIRKMKENQINLQLKERLRETRFLLRATLIQALSPIPLQIPGAVMFRIECTELSRWFFLLSLVIFNCTGIVDALSTLLLVKPYRNAITKMLQKKTVVPVADETVAVGREQEPVPVGKVSSRNLGRTDLAENEL